jgi:hypothetical protein
MSIANCVERLRNTLDVVVVRWLVACHAKLVDMVPQPSLNRPFAQLRKPEPVLARYFPKQSARELVIRYGLRCNEKNHARRQRKDVVKKLAELFDALTLAPNVIKPVE